MLRSGHGLKFFEGLFGQESSISMLGKNSKLEDS